MTQAFLFCDTSDQIKAIQTTSTSLFKSISHVSCIVAKRSVFHYFMDIQAELVTCMGHNVNGIRYVSLRHQHENGNLITMHLSARSVIEALHSKNLFSVQNSGKRENKGPSWACTRSQRSTMSNWNLKFSKFKFQIGIFNNFCCGSFDVKIR